MLLHDLLAALTELDIADVYIPMLLSISAQITSQCRAHRNLSSDLRGGRLVVPVSTRPRSDRSGSKESMLATRGICDS